MENCLHFWKTSYSKLIRTIPRLHYSPILLFTVLCSFSSSLFAQQVVTGRVTAGDTAVVGASVQLKGGTTATQTDMNGRFSINVPENATLVISSVGYGNEEVRV